ncbi:hypothetical protein Leryth_023194 [Lithospermum erythrorhizon]|nr:hypothetical protein Leryth_023194 [Lithospermum erythrorhizon]
MALHSLPANYGSSFSSQCNSQDLAIPSCCKRVIHFVTPNIGKLRFLKISRSINENSSSQIGWLRSRRGFIKRSCLSRSNDIDIDYEYDYDYEYEEEVESVHWVDRYLPENIRRFAYLARVKWPMGSILVSFPCMWSIAMAADRGFLPDIKMMIMFGLWAVTTRGAGCTINDFFDRDFDKQVERTKYRPIACGMVTPVEALWFFGFQMLLSLGILRQMNYLSFILGVIHVPLIVIYPLMKRWTYWPQAFLGVMFSWGALLGWGATKGSLDLTIVLPLYISSIFWTLVMDTIYAHQDIYDDVYAGVKSTAILFGDSTKKWITGFAIACIGSFALTGYLGNIGWSYYASLAVATCHLMWQIWTVDLSCPSDCNRKFASNKWFAAIILTGMVLGRVLH